MHKKSKINTKKHREHLDVQLNFISSLADMIVVSYWKSPSQGISPTS